MRLCNFLDTVQGIAFLYGSVSIIDNNFDIQHQRNPNAKKLRWTLRVIEIVTYFSDLVELSTIVQGWGEHHDAYNKGRFIGKMLKIGVQMYLQGTLQNLVAEWADVSFHGKHPDHKNKL